MRFPDFLIIGAMKAGTTSLYRDLASHRQIFFPLDKEPGNLAHDSVLDQEGQRAYAALYENAAPHEFCGDASTDYAKLPTVPGCAARARRLLGKNLRIIYLVREPVSRIVSHHYHDLVAKRCSPCIDEAVRQHECLLDYTRYATQLEPWLNEFGEARVKVIVFEDYVSDRTRVTQSVCEYLGIQSPPEPHRSGRAFNAASDQRRSEGLAYMFSQSSLYRRWLRPLLSPDARRILRGQLLPKAPRRPAPPSADTVAYIREQLADDIEALQDIVSSPVALWQADQDLQQSTVPAAA